VITAAAVAVPVAAEAAPPSDPAQVQAQVASLHVRSSHATTTEGARADGAGTMQKQWWANGWVRPWSNWNNWHNWPNWNNWHNWANW
jgi:hypothetical protein